MKTLAKVFLIIGMVFSGWYVIPLAIGIISLIQIDKAKSKNDLMIWGILSIIFVSPLAGIFMLLIDEKELNPTAANHANDGTVVEEIVEIVEVNGVAKERVVRKQVASPVATAVVEAEPKKQNVLAIVSLIVSIVTPILLWPMSCVFSYFGFPAFWGIGNIASLIMGIIAKKKAETLDGCGKGMATASVIVSIVVIALWVLEILAKILLIVLVVVLYIVYLIVAFVMYGAGI